MSIEIPIWYVDENQQRYRIKLKLKNQTVIDDSAWKKLHKKIKKKWVKKFKLGEIYSLVYERKQKNGQTFIDEIDGFGDFLNAWENRGTELEITVEKEDPDSDSDSDSDSPKAAMPVVTQPKVEPKPKPEEPEPVHYAIKNPLVICIGISDYKHFECEFVAGCEINTEMMLKLFINRCKYNLDLAIHNQNQNMFSLNRDDILGKFAEARDTIIKKSGDNESKIDGVIIALSGHGYGNDIYCADYDPSETSKKININDIQTAFHGEKDDEYKLPDIPKIVIIDAVPKIFEDDEEKKEDTIISKMKDWFCFSAAAVGYSDDGDWDVDKANEEGGFLMKTIHKTMQEYYDDEKNEDPLSLQKIKKKVQGYAWEWTGKIKGIGRSKIACYQSTQEKGGSVKFEIGSFIKEYRKKRCIRNPVIVNIGVSVYDDKNNLDECANDIITMKKLWTKYGYSTIICNDKKKLRKKQFDKLMKTAQKEFRKEEHDAFIISFSGHGDKDSIWLSDYDGKKGNVPVQEMTAWVSHPAVSDKDDCPRIAIIDACRGAEEVGVDRSKGTANKHPMKNWVILYSNSSGYKSENADDGSGGMLITSCFEIFGDIDRACRKKWGELKDDIGALVDKKSSSKQCCTPTGSFQHYDVYFMPKGRGKGDPTAGSQSTNDQSSATNKQ